MFYYVKSINISTAHLDRYNILLSLLFVFTIAIFCTFLCLQTIYVKCGFVNCILSEDIKLNPRPKSNSREDFSVSHWNLHTMPERLF